MGKWEHVYAMLVETLVLCIFIAIPNYWQRGRTQLIYLNDTGERISTPLPVYLANAIIPEEEVCNFGIKATALMPPQRFHLMGHDFGGRLITDAHNDFWQGKMRLFYATYNNLSLRGCNPGSAVYGQVWNELTGQRYDPIYITDNRAFASKDKATPVVFFCHGFLGNWELYQGLLSKLDNSIVVSIGTNDLSGLFSHKDIGKVFTKYLPYLEQAGYRIDKSQIHLMGLSNGGTASNIALSDFSDKFKSITFLSTGCHVIKHSRAKVIMIGGGKDGSSAGLPSAYQSLKSCGTQCAILFDENENHYMLVYKANQIMDFLRMEMEL